LSLLAVPINAAVLQVLTGGPKALFELRRDVDSPPQTTMRAYLRSLARTGVVERRRRSEFPSNVEYELAKRGRELGFVVDAVTAWLKLSPISPPPAFGSGAARSALKALVEGWSTGMVWALAGQPLSLTELDSIIASVSYHSLERRLGALRQDGLVEALPSQGRGTPYAITEWLRSAITPLVAAARWERGIAKTTPPVTDRDVEAALLLGLPMLRLPASVSGSVRLAVQVEDEGKAGLAGVVASVRAGGIEACERRLEASADSWAVGTPGAWFSAVIELDLSGLAFGGQPDLARETVEGLGRALLGRVSRGPLPG